MRAQLAPDDWLERLANRLDPPRDPHAWTPQPKQALAEKLAREVDELLYGGAAGGGKTEWGIEHCIREMEAYPGNQGAIFRRKHPSLVRSVIPRLKMKLAGGRATFNANESSFYFPNGSTLICSHLQHKDDVAAWQGPELGVIFFEEITEFLESQWEALIARLRAPVDGVRPHAIATTNPGGAGHKWVKRRWIKPHETDYDGARPEPYQTWRPKPTEERPNPLSRAFISATLDDNPKLLERDPSYRDKLRNISDRGLRKAMEEGDWDAIDAIEGALWSQAWLDGGRVAVAKAPAELRCLAVDPADGEEVEGGDDFGVWLGFRGADGVAYTEGSWAWSNSPRKMAKAAIDMYYDTGCAALVLERNHGGKWLKSVFQSIDPYVNIVEVWASEGKRTRAEPVSSLFEPDPGAKEALRYKARLVGIHEELEEEMTTFTGAPGEVSPNRLDACVWGISWLMFKNKAGTTTTYNDGRLRGRR